MLRERPPRRVLWPLIVDREGLVDGYGPTRARLVTLKRRQEYLRVRDGARWGSPSLAVESKVRTDDELRSKSIEGQGAAIHGPRFGFTVTKKIGSAVVRNRVRRRLKDAVRQTLASDGFGDVDFVVIARPAAVDRPFDDLLGEVRAAVKRVGSGVRDASASARHSRKRRQSDKPANPSGSNRN